jgi:hypothetical protein
VENRLKIVWQSNGGQFEFSLQRNHKNCEKFRCMSTLNLVREIRIFSAQIYIAISSRQYRKLQFLMVESIQFLPGWCVRR